MPYISDWTRSGGWRIESAPDTNWDWHVDLDPKKSDKFNFHGDGIQPDSDDTIKKNDGTTMGTGCKHFEQVEVTHNGTQYIIRLNKSATPKRLTCIEKNGSSGSASWTAVEG